MIPYAVLFVVVFAFSLIVFELASRRKDVSSKGWMIGWGSWVFYAAVSAAVAVALDMHPLASAGLGLVGGFAGPVVAFIYAMMTSKNGIK